MLVVDASAIADLVLETDRAAAIRERIGSESLHSPELMPVEVASVLRRLLLADEIDVEAACAALVDLDDLGVELYPHAPLLGRAMELRHSITMYDAMYIALSEALSAPVLTCDSKLKAAHGHRADVELFAN